MTRAIQSEMPKLFKMIILIYFVYFAGLDSPNSAVFLSSCRVAISSSQLQVSLEGLAAQQKMQHPYPFKSGKLLKVVLFLPSGFDDKQSRKSPSQYSLLMFVEYVFFFLRVCSLRRKCQS